MAIHSCRVVEATKKHQKSQYLNVLNHETEKERKYVVFASNNIIQVYMGKKKHKKKGDTHKMRQENQQEILVDAPEKEQRRITRLGAIIASVAVIGTMCAFLFKLTISSVNVWPEHGVIYWYLQVLFLFALSTSFIIFKDIVSYVISDLKRYNMLDQNYKQYDQESDNRYMYLLSDLRIYTIMMIFVFFLYIPVFTICGTESQKVNGIILLCLSAFAGLLFVMQYVKNKSKEDIKKILLAIGKKIAKGVCVAGLCYIVIAIYIVNNKATINVSYKANGIVEICNTSSENYNGLDIEIWNMDGEVIYTESVEKEKLLFAREDQYVNNEVDGVTVAEGRILNGEYLHWKYVFDLKKVLNESGKYCVSIKVHQDGKSAFLINSLFVENNKYIFAKDSMEKDY